MPPEYWVWEGWLARGRPQPRPACLPPRIPLSWKARHKLHVGKPTPLPPPSLGVFAESGVQFSNPGTGPLGPVEHMAGLARWGYGYASFEAFSGEPKDWSIWHREAERNYLRQLPWARCYTRDDVVRLCDIATDWGQPPIVNLENEAAGALSPKVVTEIVQANWGGEWCLQTLAILYDSVDWSEANEDGAVCALEAYANEVPRFADFDYLLRRAAPDFDRVILSIGYYDFPPNTGTYPKRALYAPARAPWLIYLGDNVHSWSEWAAP